MKKIFALTIVVSLFATLCVQAQYPAGNDAAGWAKWIEKQYQAGLNNATNRTYYFKTGNNVTFLVNLGMHFLCYKDASCDVVVAFDDYVKISSGEQSYKSRFGNILLCKMNNGSLVVNSPHSEGDVWISSCSKSDYEYAKKNCTYTDSRFSSDMKSVSKIQYAANNSSSSSSSGSSSSGGTSGLTFEKSVSALVFTVSGSKITYSSYQSVDIYRASDGSHKVKIGSNAACTFNLNTTATYLGLNVSSYRYWTMTASYNNTQTYYYFNL